MPWSLLSRLLVRFHRLEIRPGATPVRIESDRGLLAESDRALQALEAGSPVRWYVPRADVRAELVRSGRRTRCPFKGLATHYRANGAEVAWSYEDPLPPARALRGMIGFGDGAEATLSTPAAAPRGDRPARPSRAPASHPDRA